METRFTVKHVSDFKRKRGSRGSRRKKEPPVQKAPNKRKVFEESDSHETEPTPRPPEKRSKSSQGCSRRDFNRNTLLRPSIFWSRLSLRGPYCDHEAPVEVHKNRPLYNLYRLICHRIHENCVEYLQNDVSTIPQRMGPPDVLKAQRMMSEMCVRVLKVEENGRTYFLNSANMFDAITRVFTNGSVTLLFDMYPEILNGLRAMCHHMNITAPPDLLELVKDGLIRQFSFMAADLLTFLLQISPSNGILVIGGYRPFNVFPNTSFHTLPNTTAVCAAHRRLTTIQDKQRYRSTVASLWTSIPYEEADHLLLHVFEYGLIQLLPQSVKEFFTSWMVEVRWRMIRWANEKTLQSLVRERLVGNKTPPFLVSWEDKQMKRLIATVLHKVLPGNLVLPWLNYALEVVRRDQRNILDPYSEFFQVSENDISDSGFSKLNELFSDSPTDQAMLYHTRVQLLRFYIMFACHTIRHIFDNDEHFNLIYDGHLEEEEHIDIDKYTEYERNPIVKLPTEMETPTVTRPPIQPLLAPGPSSIVPGFLPPNHLPPSFNSSVPPPMLPFPPQFSGFPETPTPELTEKKWVPVPVKTEKRSFLPEELMTTPAPSKPPPLLSVVKQEDPLSPEVTDEELRRARALRTPSESSLSLRIDEEEGAIPKKWIDAYKLTLEWNEDLKRQLTRVEARYEKMCK